MLEIILFAIVSFPTREAGKDMPEWRDKPGYKPLGPQDSSWNVQLVGWIDSVGPEIGGMVAHKDGEVIYLGARVNGDTNAILVLDISDPANPHIHKEIRHDSLRWISPALTVDTFLYVWCGQYFGKGTYVYDWDAYSISDPLNPVFVKTIWHYEGGWEKQPGNMWWSSGWVYDTILYADDDYRTFNIKDPLNPVPISEVEGGASHHFFLYPYIYTCGDAYGDTFPFMIYDVSDPENMFKVCEKWYWAPYGLSPRTIGAWELNGKRYVYMTGADLAWSLDVTDPHNPVVLNFGDRGYQTYGSVTHGTRFYGFGLNNLSQFTVYSLEDPVHIPVVGWYRSDSIWFLEKGVWANGYVVASGSWLAHYPSEGIAIFQYAGDQVKEEPLPSSSVISFLRTIYTEPGLEFSLSGQAQVSFSLFNSVGQKAYQKDLGLLEPGLHRVALPQLGTGVYFLFLSANGTRFYQKLVFTR